MPEGSMKVDSLGRLIMDDPRQAALICAAHRAVMEDQGNKYVEKPGTAWHFIQEDGEGVCRDFSLGFLAELGAMGFPGPCLRVHTCWALSGIESAEDIEAGVQFGYLNHAVLGIVTTRGRFMCDSRRKVTTVPVQWDDPWFRNGYRFVSAQSSGLPGPDGKMPPPWIDERKNTPEYKAGLKLWPIYSTRVQP